MNIFMSPFSLLKITHHIKILKINWTYEYFKLINNEKSIERKTIGLSKNYDDYINSTSLLNNYENNL